MSVGVQDTHHSHAWLQAALPSPQAVMACAAQRLLLRPLRVPAPV